MSHPGSQRLRRVNEEDAAADDVGDDDGGGVERARGGARERVRLVEVVCTRGFNHEVRCHSVSSLRSIGNSPILAHVREPWRANRSTLTSMNSLFCSMSVRGWVPV